MSGIKLPVTVEMGCIFDANGFEVDPEEIAAALNAAPKQAFERLNPAMLRVLIREASQGVDSNRLEAEQERANNLLSLLQEFAAPKRAVEAMTAEELEDALIELNLAYNLGEIDALRATLLNFTAPIAPAWQPIETAPRNRTPILARFKDNLVHIRPDLIKWEGKCCVVNHVGVLVDGFDIGWGVDAPVGYGGIPDEWIAGWQPLPAAPEERGGPGHG